LESLSGKRGGAHLTEETPRTPLWSGEMGGIGGGMAESDQKRLKNSRGEWEKVSFTQKGGATDRRSPRSLGELMEWLKVHHPHHPQQQTPTTPKPPPPAHRLKAKKKTGANTEGKRR